MEDHKSFRFSPILKSAIPHVKYGPSNMLLDLNELNNIDGIVVSIYFGARGFKTCNENIL